MIFAQEHQKEYYNHHQEQEPSYQVPDKVWLEARNITTDRPSDKLKAKRLSPFNVAAKISSHAYRLELPPSMKIHPVFHVSLLTPHIVDTIPGRTQPPPLPVVVEDQEEWEVEKILNSRYCYSHLQYLVKWKGFGGENSWEPAENLEHSPRPVHEYE